MLPDRVSNPGPLTYESGALPIALRGPAPGLGPGELKRGASMCFCHFYEGDNFCEVMFASLDEKKKLSKWGLLLK